MCADFRIRAADAAQRMGVSEEWTRRKPKPGRKIEPLSLDLAKRLLKVRDELLGDYRRKPASAQGGRPRQLTPSDVTELPRKYDELRSELKMLRRWLRDQSPTPSMTKMWDWLCGEFRAGRLGTVKLWPQFYTWVEKSYNNRVFRQGDWIPRDLAIQFLCDDYGASEPSVTHLLSHY
jgi:hypothetical protein